jgi:hypothetical protein
MLCDLAVQRNDRVTEFGLLRRDQDAAEKRCKDVSRGVLESELPKVSRTSVLESETSNRHCRVCDNQATVVFSPLEEINNGTVVAGLGRVHTQLSASA